MAPQLWEIVGGADKGGILVRQGQELTSTALEERLSTGAHIEELRLAGSRLYYSLVSGAGPQKGWISTSLKDKVLANKIDQPAPSAATPKQQQESPPQQQSEQTGAAGASPAEAIEAAWIKESRRKLQAYRDGAEYLPPKLTLDDLPKRLRDGHPGDRLPPFKRLTPAQMDEMSEKNLPGHFSGLKFPHNTEQLRSFGAKFFTEAFHKFGTLKEDNAVTRVVKVEQLPLGAELAHGAVREVPWGYHESETGKAYRMQISTYADMDAPELMTYMCCESVLPCRIPKLYFCDISRETTNYMLILERVPFGRRGRVEKGKVVEKIDNLLEDPAKVYFCIFREMAHIAAWDQLGHFDAFFKGPLPKYDQEGFLAYCLPRRKPKTLKKEAVTIDTTKKVMEIGIEFATKTARAVFPAAARDEKMLRKMIDDIAYMQPQMDAINDFMASTSDYTAAMHMNLQADNAFFWCDEKGDMDCGVFDWCGFNRTPFIGNFMGCLSGADADVLDAHEEGLMKIFCDEYKRYGGPQLDWRDVLLRYHLRWGAFVADSVQWIERDIFRECPKDEWGDIKSIFDEKFMADGTSAAAERRSSMRFASGRGATSGRSSMTGRPALAGPSWSSTSSKACLVL
eukprot:CAMPEP_0115545616 /NCGR_PEP_ID=MMETSP0271-20121206/92697_1 /TAXON_ID=71861 /ORGANISM="Scrippsiella trochoidea, Strain CCMP3099" /LENGTH=623 /DNA_ID=CAMNT_0002978971 /DNA_START=24 /DNA_END=1894 /DNA_ORIENTATION=+